MGNTDFATEPMQNAVALDNASIEGEEEKQEEVEVEQSAANNEIGQAAV